MTSKILTIFTRFFQLLWYSSAHFARVASVMSGMYFLSAFIPASKLMSSVPLIRSSGTPSSIALIIRSAKMPPSKVRRSCRMRIDSTGALEVFGLRELVEVLVGHPRIA